jgi:hypothetical protein
VRAPTLHGTGAWLLEMAREDFAALRRDPPLLYHNDLTASVSRYYWSADVGYALWLRLYQARLDQARLDEAARDAERRPGGPG